MNERTIGAVRGATVVSVGCLAIAAAWSLLFGAAVTAPAGPSGDNATLFAWWRPVAWQTAGFHLLAAAGFIGLVVVAATLRGHPASRAHAAQGLRAAAALIAAGALVVAIANVIRVGGQQAVLDASTTRMDPDILGTIGYTVDRIADALQSGGYAVLGVGALALAPMLRGSRVDRLWDVSAVALGSGVLALAVVSQTDASGLVDPITALLALVVLPVWAWRLQRHAARPEPVNDSDAVPWTAAAETAAE